MIDKDSDTDRKKIREDTMINSSDSKNYKKISNSLKQRRVNIHLFFNSTKWEFKMNTIIFSLIYSSLITEETEEERKAINKQIVGKLICK